jgi:hypothetical protein
MIHSQNEKIVALFKPQSVATNATASGTVSVTSWDYAKVVAHLDTAAASSTDATLEVSFGDGTSFTTEAALAMTTAAPDTSNQQFYAWFIDLRHRAKNLKLAYTPSGAARIASAHVVLSRGEQAPNTTSERGLAGQVVG